MDRYNTTSLKSSLRKIYKVFLILFLQVVIYKLIVFIFKDFKFNIVVNFNYRRKVDFLTPLLLTFVDLLTDVCYIIQRSVSV